jgi:hypothetical protein
MNEPINVTRDALVRLLDAVLYPNPDDPGDPSSPWGPYGPIGPVISGLLRDLSWVLLNPQPLPPRDIRLVISGALRDLSWVLLNPQPLPPREIGALQKVLGRFRRSRSVKREEVVYGDAGRLGFGVLLILVIISLSVWLLRRRTTEETAPVPLEAKEEAVRLEDEEEVVMPPGAPSAEDVALREAPPPGEERPERRGVTPTTPPTPREEPPPGEERPGRR